MKLTTEIFIEKAKSVHGDKYDYSAVIYKNMKTKVQIICPIHGIFEQTPDKHLHGHCGCPLCAGNCKSNVTDFVDKSKKIHGDKYDYSSVEYVNNRTPVRIICPKHGAFMQSPSNHLRGKGCPHCANNTMSNTDEFVKKAMNVHGNKYDYSLVDYQGNRMPVDIICPIHGKFRQIVYVHLNGCGCPQCGLEKQIEHRDESLIRAKAELTCLRRYGASNPMNNKVIREKHKKAVESDVVRDKRIQTKRKNQSFNTSLSEYRLGVLLKSLFGEDNVCSNYVSDAYPFKCDFYIKSRDMYIELNAHWSHGGHWYCADDKDTIDTWMSKSKFYQNAAQTFSVRDVIKRQTALKNDLNYIVFWKTDLSDVHEWISRGCPDGQDWAKEYSWL